MIKRLLPVAIHFFALALMAQTPTPLWTAKPARDNFSSTFRLIMPLADGSFLAAGDKGFAVNDRHPWLLRVNGEGVVIREWTLSAETVDRVLDAALLPDGRVALACTTGTALEVIVVSSEGQVLSRWPVKPAGPLADQVEWVGFLLADNRTLEIGFNQWMADLPASREFINAGYRPESGELPNEPERRPGRALAALVTPYGSFHAVMQKQEGPGIEMYSAYPALGDERTGIGGSANAALMMYLPNDRLLLAVQGESKAGAHPISVNMIDPRDHDNIQSVWNWANPPEGVRLAGFGGLMMPLPLVVAHSDLLGQAVFSTVPLNEDSQPIMTAVTGGIFYPQAVCSNVKGQLIIAGFSRRSVADTPEIICLPRP